MEDDTPLTALTAVTAFPEHIINDTVYGQESFRTLWVYGQESVWWYTQCTVKHFLKTKVIWKWIQKAPERHKMCKKKDTKHPWPVWDLGMVQCGADLWFICHQSKSFTINTSLGFPDIPDLLSSIPDLSFLINPPTCFVFWGNSGQYKSFLWAVTIKKGTCTYKA